LFVSNRGVPINRCTLWVLMRDYAEAAGIHVSKRKFHALKHSIATHLLDAGADIAIV
jgi:site-specific recombinase XerD